MKPSLSKLKTSSIDLYGGAVGGGSGSSSGGGGSGGSGQRSISIAEKALKWLDLITFSPRVDDVGEYRVERVKKYSRWFKVSFYVKLKK